MQNLIFFNFYILGSKLKKKHQFLNKTNKSIVHFPIENYKSFKILNLIELLKQVKQLIRILFFLKKKKKTLLHLITNDSLFINILKNKKILNKKKLHSILYENEYFKNKPKIYATAFNFLKNNEKNYLNFFNKKIFILNNINNNNLNQDYGAYKMNANIEDWRKMIFFIILLKKFYAKNTKI